MENFGKEHKLVVCVPAMNLYVQKVQESCKLQPPTRFQNLIKLLTPTRFQNSTVCVYEVFNLDRKRRTDRLSFSSYLVFLVYFSQFLHHICALLESFVCELLLFLLFSTQNSNNKVRLILGRKYVKSSGVASRGLCFSIEPEQTHTEAHEQYRMLKS